MSRPAAKKEQSTSGVYQLKLYFAAGSPHSVQAIYNLQQICRKHLGGAYKLELIDVLREPARALRDEVLVTPTLVMVSPEPGAILIGDLSPTAAVLDALGLIQRGAE